MPNYQAFINANPNVPNWDAFLDKLEVKDPNFTESTERNISNLLRIPLVVPPYLPHLSSLPPEDSLGETLLGVEVEVEGINNPPTLPYLWEGKVDGSLRNNGVEYVTFPTPAKYIPALFSMLQDELAADNFPCYSPRTSTHVHINVLDMSLEQLKAFVMLYLVFENTLFNFVGNNRNKSIFCIPLSHAGYVSTLKKLFSLDYNRAVAKHVFTNWHKYTSLNLRTIATFGTVEFRHLHGTDDSDLFSTWLSLILRLKEKAMTISIEKLYKTIAELNTNSEYEVFAFSVFGRIREVLPHNLQYEMERDVSHIKDCLEEVAAIPLNYNSFVTSSFFLNHKIKEIALSEEERRYINQTVEQLRALLDALGTAYKGEAEYDKREKIAEDYRLIDKVITLKLNRENF